jgi:hypothetical protein
MRDTNATQLRLLSTLVEARRICSQLQQDLEGHECEPGRDGRCEQCNLRLDVAGIAWGLETYHGILDCQTAGDLSATAREYQEHLIETGQPVPPAIARAAARSAPIAGAPQQTNPFYS